jgi:hypothetical protein
MKKIRQEDLREGWTVKDVEDFLRDTKELERIEVEHGVERIPHWLNDRAMKECYIEKLMMTTDLNGDEIEKKAEEMVREANKLIERFEKDDIPKIKIAAWHYETVLVDPEAVGKNLLEQYRKFYDYYREDYPDWTDERIVQEVDVRLERIRNGAVARLERLKKLNKLNEGSA